MTLAHVRRGTPEKKLHGLHMQLHRRQQHTATAQAQPARTLRARMLQLRSQHATCRQPHSAWLPARPQPPLSHLLLHLHLHLPCTVCSHVLTEPRRQHRRQPLGVTALVSTMCTQLQLQRLPPSSSARVQLRARRRLAPSHSNPWVQGLHQQGLRGRQACKPGHHKSHISRRQQLRLQQVRGLRRVAAWSG